MLVSLAAAPATPDRDNEDFITATPNAVVLLDGAGTPVGSECGCSHGVAWFVRALGTTLLTEVATSDSSLADALSASILRVRSLHEDTCDLDHAGSPSATVVAVRVRGSELEYLVLADSTLVLDMVGGEPVVISDDREARIGRQHRARMDALPTGTAEHTAAHREYVETMRSYRNRPGGFWVASVDPDAAREATSGVVPLDGLRAAALLSDGASRLVDRFHLATWPELLKILDEDGPGELIRRVRSAEDTDPRGERWPRGKARDDASVAYLRFMLA